MGTCQVYDVSAREGEPHEEIDRWEMDTYVVGDLPADEPLANVLDADEDTNGAPIHGKILDGIYVLSSEGLVRGEGWEEESEPGAGEEEVSIQ